MHVVDWFATVLRIVGLGVPSDRVIDSIDLLDWLTGQRDTSAREGYIYWMGSRRTG
jgi:arylsulfatase